MQKKRGILAGTLLAAMLLATAGCGRTVSDGVRSGIEAGISSSISTLAAALIDALLNPGV